jgi:DNA-binding transcriptional MerR regulator
MHYTQQHLDRLIQIRTWQEAGISLGEIESRVRGSAPAIARSVPAGADANLWRRFAPHPGVELHINTQTRLDEAEIERILQGIRRLLGEK